MVHILVTATLPGHKGKEMTTVYLSGKQAKYPDFVKKIHQWYVMDNEIKAYAVYEVPDDKVYETILAIGKRYNAYVAIEGYKYKIEVLIAEKDVLAMIPK